MLHYSKRIRIEYIYIYTISVWTTAISLLFLCYSKNKSIRPPFQSNFAPCFTRILVVKLNNRQLQNISREIFGKLSRCQLFVHSIDSNSRCRSFSYILPDYQYDLYIRIVFQMFDPLIQMDFQAKSSFCILRNTVGYRDLRFPLHHYEDR